MKALHCTLGALLVLLGHSSICNIVEAQSVAPKLLFCSDEASNNREPGCFLSTFGSVMHLLEDNECREKCVIVPSWATTFGWKCGSCPDSSPTSPALPPVLSPVKTPVQPPVTRPSVAPPPVAPSPVAPPSAASFKCGGAVNTGGVSANATCTSDLWNPTQNRNMHCYAYGGVTDPCALHNNNDVNDGLFKSPANCDRDTFYLWDEPDTQGKSYRWAGLEWLKYSIRFAPEIQLLRKRGVRFTSPLMRTGEPGVTASNLKEFYFACGSQCRNVSSPSYINVNAANVFIGPWNVAGIQGCRDGANYMVNEIQEYFPTDKLPWYITNWSRLGTYNVSDQVDAMNVIHLFFQSGSPIERIYWFGATDYGGNSGNNFLTQATSNGSTLGQIWQGKCSTL